MIAASPLMPSVRDLAGPSLTEADLAVVALVLGPGGVMSSTVPSEVVSVRGELLAISGARQECGARGKTLDLHDGRVPFRRPPRACPTRSSGRTSLYSSESGVHLLAAAVAGFLPVAFMRKRAGVRGLAGKQGGRAAAFLHQG